MSLIQYCATRLKSSVCNSLFAAGVRSTGDLPPQCTGVDCAKYFGCLRESCEDLDAILEYEDLEIEASKNEEKKIRYDLDRPVVKRAKVNRRKSSTVKKCRSHT